ncbi:ribosomal protein S18-alanine N-acetyltransferase [Sulfobacillus thermosulfidooxidans]|uniref:ribosomal protein S18-alanine N-acetyltransferase n=1 Tax=Sulfobacillus thermosulfidooxidans TaxID=28034 RepID=UPI00041FB01D|nr:ribosomal protein S18-alanine N-acetyltransferase [Sulfobacillus thermosulfidooxidans]
MAISDDRTGNESSQSSSDIVIRDMYMADLDAVMGIESHSFPTPWSRNAFQTELLENTFATYLVVEFHGKVVAYGGMWIILDEAHVTNVAVHPDYRGHHLGEAIMMGLIERAKRAGVVRMTLEVRRSNLVAQNLYNKLGFVQLGVRRGYYTDTREDAFIMWKDPL